MTTSMKMMINFALPLKTAKKYGAKMDRNADISVGHIRQIDGGVGRALAGGWAPGGVVGRRGAEV